MAVRPRYSSKIETCIAGAVRSAERAAEAPSAETRRFFLKMEASWMRLAAAIAFRERVDGLLAKARRAAENCLRCRGPMQVKLVEPHHDCERVTFECRSCGRDHIHAAQRVTVG
jgi:hypothetical protein